MSQTLSRIRFLAVGVVMLVLVFTLFRGAFFLWFSPPTDAIEPAAVARAFYLGFKYDLRLALLLQVPFALLGLLRPLDPTRTPRARAFWLNHLTLLTVVLGGFYIFDLGNYAYLTERADASAMRYMANPAISLQMVWETYPVVWGAVAALAAAFGFRWLLDRLLPTPPAVIPTAIGRRWSRWLLISAVVVAYIAGIYGKFSHYPLRWSDAFFSTEKFIADLAVNPFLFFADSVGTAEQEQPFDLDRLDERHGRIAAYLGIENPDPERRHLARYVRPLAAGPVRPNFVVVFLESFAAHRTGIAGNPLEASPNFDAIAQESLLFRHFYTQRTGTARGVFTTLTGVPDTITYRTASRNPRTIVQNTVLRAFEGYRKFYFRGGSASWANIRALFIHNHQEFEIYEEGDFTSARVDVWGIPDYHLVEEANAVLRTIDDAPFISFVHLAGNHRPYTIPEDIPGFSLRSEDEAVLRENGFISLPEFNSYRLLDHSLGHLIELARQESYFDNTIFILMSDNGSSYPNVIVPPCEEALRLGVYHAPLAIYSPALLPEGRVIDTPANQMDVMPTVAALAGIPALNTTLGRNLLDPRFEDGGAAFMYRTRGKSGEIILYDGLSATLVDTDGTNLRHHVCPGEVPLENVASEFPDRARESAELAQGLYDASKYLLYNNLPGLYEKRGLSLLRAEPLEAGIPNPETELSSSTVAPEGSVQ